MSNQARPDDDRPLSVQLDLRLDREPISGRLSSELGPAQSFVGWLGFACALRRMAEAQTNERSES